MQFTHSTTKLLLCLLQLFWCDALRDGVILSVSWSVGRNKKFQCIVVVYMLYSLNISPTDQNIFSLNCVVALHVMIMLIAFTSHVSVASIFAECKKATSLHLCCTAPNSYLIQLEHRHLLHHHSVIAVNLIKE